MVSYGIVGSMFDNHYYPYQEKEVYTQTIEPRVNFLSIHYGKKNIIKIKKKKKIVYT